MDEIDDEARRLDDHRVRFNAGLVKLAGISFFTGVGLAFVACVAESLDASWSVNVTMTAVAAMMLAYSAAAAIRLPGRDE